MDSEKPKTSQKLQQFDSSDKRYLLLVGMGIVALIATFIVVIYYLRIEMNLLRSGKMSAPDTSIDIQVNPSPEVLLSPFPSY